jgi:hypothetical protein
MAFEMHWNRREIIFITKIIVHLQIKTISPFELFPYPKILPAKDISSSKLIMSIQKLLHTWQINNSMHITESAFSPWSRKSVHI